MVRLRLAAVGRSAEKTHPQREFINGNPEAFRVRARARARARTRMTNGRSYVVSVRGDGRSLSRTSQRLAAI